MSSLPIPEVSFPAAMPLASESVATKSAPAPQKDALNPAHPAPSHGLPATSDVVEVERSPLKKEIEVQVDLREPEAATEKHEDPTEQELATHAAQLALDSSRQAAAQQHLEEEREALESEVSEKQDKSRAVALQEAERMQEERQRQLALEEKVHSCSHAKLCSPHVFCSLATSR